MWLLSEMATPHRKAVGAMTSADIALVAVSLLHLAADYGKQAAELYMYMF